MPHDSSFDFIVIGAGSSGCAVAAGLVEREAGSVLVLEAGPSDRWPLVRMPFGLVWTIGSAARDWRYQSTRMPGIGGRSLAIPRGRVIGGSGSINSMVWFRGCRSDFDDWAVPGWGWNDVAPAFDAVEARLAPSRMTGAHPLTEALGGIMANDPQGEVTPEREGGGVWRFNMRNGRRWSSADAFLRPAQEHGAQVLQRTEVHRILIEGDRAAKVELRNGTCLAARKGVILAAGAIGSPEILLRSGIGPASDLRAAGVDVVRDAPEVGENLHDHPGCGIHYAGPGSGYGLTLGHAWTWLSGPVRWLVSGQGVLASPTVEGGLFLDSTGNGGPPDIQSHFIPFNYDWNGRRYVLGAGYFADAVVCRPKSRGRLSMAKDGLSIDLGLFAEPDDFDRLTRGWLRVRRMMAEADFAPHTAPEVYPGKEVQGEDAVQTYIRDHAATAYHPVGTLRMGDYKDAPVGPRLKFRGVDGLWVADASVMPRITSANTNAPSMMIGQRAGQFIAEDAA